MKSHRVQCRMPSGWMGLDTDHSIRPQSSQLRWRNLLTRNVNFTITKQKRAHIQLRTHRLLKQPARFANAHHILCDTWCAPVGMLALEFSHDYRAGAMILILVFGSQHEAATDTYRIRHQLVCAPRRTATNADVNV